MVHHLRVTLRCHGEALLTLLLLAVSGARKAVATDTALVHTARYARASRAIALGTDEITSGNLRGAAWANAGACSTAMVRSSEILLSSRGEIRTGSHHQHRFLGSVGSWIAFAPERQVSPLPTQQSQSPTPSPSNTRTSAADESDYSDHGRRYELIHHAPPFRILATHLHRQVCRARVS